MSPLKTLLHIFSKWWESMSDFHTSPGISSRPADLLFDIFFRQLCSYSMVKSSALIGSSFSITSSIGRSLISGWWPRRDWKCSFQRLRRWLILSALGIAFLLPFLPEIRFTAFHSFLAWFSIFCCFYLFDLLLDSAISLLMVRLRKLFSAFLYLVACNSAVFLCSLA